MAYTRGFTMKLAKYITDSIPKTETLVALSHFSFTPTGIELKIVKGRMVRTETPGTMNNVTDSFLSL